MFVGMIMAREKVVIPESKSYIFLRGNGKGRTAIVWDDSSNNNTESASFTVWADNIIVFGISFKVHRSLLVFEFYLIYLKICLCDYNYKSYLRNLMEEFK